jgi:hypothetical protein
MPTTWPPVGFVSLSDDDEVSVIDYAGSSAAQRPWQGAREQHPLLSPAPG